MANLTREDVRKYIKRRLGYPSTVVELENEQLDDAIEDALEEFNNHLCRFEPRVAYGRSGAVQIQLDEESERGVAMVKVLYPEENRIAANFNIFEIMYRMIFPHMPLGEWVMLKSYYELYQRTRGTDPDWYLDRTNRVLHVDCASGPYDIFYLVVKDVRVEDFSEGQRQYLSKFRKLCVANAKLTLAEVRGKFTATIPVPGGSLTTNAEKLIADGLLDKQEIREWLEKTARFSVTPILLG